MKTIKTLALAAGLILGLTPLSHAHDDAYLDTQTAPHGGQLRMAAGSHYELVVVKDSTGAKDKPLVIYVTDHAGTKIPTAGASGSITLLSGKTKVSAALTPDGDNKLTGHAVYASTPDLKAVVKVKLAGQDEQQARFTPLATQATSHEDHKH
ncbi:hypothetical protein [Roseateles koreensis]|uniref:Uncharacterized protein n=1 Tax=Roseateles koreensis TaxID=2987526 RepID=A0ABT5KT48_9BURK|nr:hypothetical protein [Roseateles koreensis]MDC8786114.1 hypothetical protein [Roseateles koreensis]